MRADVRWGQRLGRVADTMFRDASGEPARTAEAISAMPGDKRAGPMQGI